MRPRSLLVSAAALLGLALGAAPARAAAAAPKDAPGAESVYTRRGPLGGVRLGVLAGVGFPDGVQGSFVVRAHEIFGAGLTLAGLPAAPVPGVESATLTRVSGEAFLRVYPFKGAFFLGAGFGAMRMAATQSDTTRTPPVGAVDAHARASALYVAPEVGFLWMTKSGFSFGSDVGVQIPVVSSGPTFDVERAGMTTAVDGKGGVADAMRFASRSPIPVVNVIRVGFVL